jgi:hypothetical protein
MPRGRGRDLLGRDRTRGTPQHRIRPGRVTGIDAGRRQVVATRPGGEKTQFGYDYLIVAV